MYDSSVCYLFSVLAHVHVLIKNAQCFAYPAYLHWEPLSQHTPGALSGLHQLWLTFLHCDARLFLTRAVREQYDGRWTYAQQGSYIFLSSNGAMLISITMHSWFPKRGVTSERTQSLLFLQALSGKPDILEVFVRFDKLSLLRRSSQEFWWPPRTWLKTLNHNCQPRSNLLIAKSSLLLLLMSDFFSFKTHSSIEIYNRTQRYGGAQQ